MTSLTVLHIIRNGCCKFGFAVLEETAQVTHLGGSQADSSGIDVKTATAAPYTPTVSSLQGHTISSCLKNLTNYSPPGTLAARKTKKSLGQAQPIPQILQVPGNRFTKKL